MGTTIPGGVSLDTRGRPTDANGEKLPPLSDDLSDEEKKALRGAGVVTSAQTEFYDPEQLAQQFGVEEDLAQKAAGEKDLFKEPEGADDSLEGVEFGSQSAEDLAVEAGLSADDFGMEPSGKTGYTKADVEAVIEAKE